MTKSAIDTLTSLRTATYEKNSRLSCNPCEVCGREITDPESLMVETEQGDYPIGATCAAKVRKAGLTVYRNEV